MSEKNFKSMARMQKNYAKLYGSKGAGLIGISDEYVQLEEEAFAMLCFDVLGTFHLKIKGGTPAKNPADCTYIQLCVVFDGVEFHALGSPPEWNAVGFPMTEAVLYAQADRGLDHIPGSKNVGFWGIVLAHLVYLLGEKSPAERGA